MTDSRVTPQAAAVDAVDRQLLSWFEDEMSAEHRRVLALEIVERSGVALLLCQPLQDEIDRLRAVVETTLDKLDALRTTGEIPFGIGMGWRGGVEIATHNIRAALAASPVGTD